jgi:hypothetical protein
MCSIGGSFATVETLSLSAAAVACNIGHRLKQSPKALASFLGATLNNQNWRYVKAAMFVEAGNLRAGNKVKDTAVV